MADTGGKRELNPHDDMSEMKGKVNENLDYDPAEILNMPLGDPRVEDPLKQLGTPDPHEETPLPDPATGPEKPSPIPSEFTPPEEKATDQETPEAETPDQPKIDEKAVSEWLATKQNEDLVAQQNEALIQRIANLRNIAAVPTPEVTMDKFKAKLIERYGDEELVNQKLWEYQEFLKDIGTQVEARNTKTTIDLISNIVGTQIYESDAKKIRASFYGANKDLDHKSYYPLINRISNEVEGDYPQASLQQKFREIAARTRNEIKAIQSARNDGSVVETEKLPYTPSPGGTRIGSTSRVGTREKKPKKPQNQNESVLNDTFNFVNGRGYVI